MQNYLLFDASNSVDNSNECRFALLKLLSVYNLKPPRNLTVIIHTNFPRLFDDYQNFYKDLQVKERLNSDQSDKNSLIQSFFTTNEGNLLIADTSTYPIKPLDDLFHVIQKNTVVIQPKSFKKPAVNYNLWKQARAIITKSRQKPASLPLQQEGPTVPDWVVLGLNHALELQKHAPAKTAIDYFAQYSELKEFRMLLQTFFSKNEEESIPNLVKLSNHLDAVAIQKEKEKHEKLPLYKKWWDDFTGKGWSIRKYERRIS